MVKMVKSLLPSPRRKKTQDPQDDDAPVPTPIAYINILRLGIRIRNSESFPGFLLYPYPYPYPISKERYGSNAPAVSWLCRSWVRLSSVCTPQRSVN
jgi:hypothetical protein